MGSAETTPRPWDYVPSTEHHGPYITSDFGGTIADLYLMSELGALSVRNGGTSKPVHFFHEMADPNAELIVRAVNAHDALLAFAEYVAGMDPNNRAPLFENARAVIALAKGGAEHSSTNEEAA